MNTPPPPPLSPSPSFRPYHPLPLLWQASTKIPVMGHSEGICHVYIDKAADPTKASEIAVDAKVCVRLVFRLVISPTCVVRV